MYLHLSACVDLKEVLKIMKLCLNDVTNNLQKPVRELVFNFHGSYPVNDYFIKIQKLERNLKFILSIPKIDSYL